MTRALILLFASFAGCATTSAATAQSDAQMPQPTVAPAAAPSESVLFRVGDGVPETLKNNGPNEMWGTRLSDWHQILERGFWNGFSPYLKAPPKGSEPGLIVEIVRTVSSTYYPNGRPVARLVFSARLLDGTGKALRVSSGSTESKVAISFAWEGRKLIVDTVEAMYEQISKDLFATPLPAVTGFAPAAPAAPSAAPAAPASPAAAAATPGAPAASVGQIEAPAAPR